MALLLNLIFSLAFAGAVGGAVHAWRVHRDGDRRDGMQALAARRGWALTITGERLGRAGTLRIVPRGGHPWVAEARTREGHPGGPITEYEAEEPRWIGGTLVLVAAEAGSPLDLSTITDDPTLGRDRQRVLCELLGEDMARLVGQLDVVPAPPGATALSDADPVRRLNLRDLMGILSAFPPVAFGPKGRPVLILSPEGMRLRLRHAVRRPDQMERFLDLALDLSRLIGP